MFTDVYLQGYQAMGLRLAVDMGVFDAADRLREQDKPVSLASLATETGVNELLLRMSISVVFACFASSDGFCDL
jgi:hypothetical protein